ncbi:MAG: hypothetical protein WC521_02710 [Bdellovibrionales bacterium]|jgi:hypothetical protein
MKYRTFLLATCVLAFLFLSGCAEKWQKPGATEQDFEKMKLSCDNQALKRFPILLRQIQIEGERMTPFSTRCTGSGPTLSCSTSGGQYVPPTYAPMDDNRAAREAATRRCYIENGWHPAENE